MTITGNNSAGLARWTAYDAKRSGLKLPNEIQMTTQDRAYTPPIWYTPSK